MTSRPLLLTGATGLIGSALLERLVARGDDVRCLVRDPARLGPAAARVQVVRGDLAHPEGFDAAVEGVGTVVHLAAAIRDQRGGSIEALNATATVRLVAAAERAGARRLVFFSAQGVSLDHSVRFMRAKAVAERAVAESPLPHTIFAPSLVYAPGDPFLTLLERMARLPVVPLGGHARAVFEPIWAQDVADCVVAALERPDAGARYELSGPEALSYEQIVEVVLLAAGRPRRILHVPLGLVRPALRALEVALGPRAFATWEEARLMELTMVAAHGTADARALGISPRRMDEALMAP
jgi:NADH dehydrogenase